MLSLIAVQGFRIKNIIQDFLYFALARPVHTLSITGFISVSDINVNEEYMHNISLQIYHTEFTDPFIARKKYRHVLFLFRHIDENFGTAIGKWIEAEDVLRDVI